MERAGDGARNPSLTIDDEHRLRHGARSVSAPVLRASCSDRRRCEHLRHRPNRPDRPRSLPRSGSGTADGTVADDDESNHSFASGRQLGLDGLDGLDDVAGRSGSSDCDQAAPGRARISLTVLDLIAERAQVRGESFYHSGERAGRLWPLLLFCDPFLDLAVEEDE
jgi:hypothetical protein